MWLICHELSGQRICGRVRLFWHDVADRISRRAWPDFWFASQMEEWLAGEAAGLPHAELEEQLKVRGRELVRRLL